MNTQNKVDKAVQATAKMKDFSVQTSPARELIIHIMEPVNGEPSSKKSKPTEEKEMPFKCSIEGCNRAYDTKKSLRQHERDHNAEFYCPNCPASFTRKRRFDDHVVKCNGLKK